MEGYLFYVAIEGFLIYLDNEKPIYDLHSLSDQHIRTYEGTWTHTGLVQINDRTLVFRHFHTYPPY